MATYIYRALIKKKRPDYAKFDLQLQLCSCGSSFYSAVRAEKNLPNFIIHTAHLFFMSFLFGKCSALYIYNKETLFLFV